MKRVAIIIAYSSFSVAFVEIRDDGSKFMIDRPFEVKHFKVWGERKPVTWGFVSENILPLNHKGYDEVPQIFRFLHPKQSFKTQATFRFLASAIIKGFTVFR